MPSLFIDGAFVQGSRGATSSVVGRPVAAAARAAARSFGGAA